MSPNDREPRMPLRQRRRGGGSTRRAQRGVALLVAILLVALGTIIAAAMAYNNAMTARRAAAGFEFDQALLLAQGTEALAAYGLQQQAQQNSPYIAPTQSWAQPLGPVQAMPGVTLQGSLEDLQGRFNINDLVQTDGTTPNTIAIQAFQRLLTMLQLDPKWAEDTVNWIDKSPTPMFPNAAADSAYLEMDPPYRSPELPITSTSELMALPGFTRADFDKLAPYIVALPIGTQINVCSASKYLLDALTGTLQFSQDPEFDQNRRDAGGCFPSPQLVMQAATDIASAGSSSGAAVGANGANGNAQQQSLSSLLAQKSSWFRLTTFIDMGSAEFAVYTLLYQDQTGMVQPVMRSFTPD
jgi:general secretion pathway protein K